MSEAKNTKYEITDIAHEKDPFLHRIRALRDFGDVKAGDLGGFVEGEFNLSFEPDDISWIYNDAIAAGCSVVEKDSRLYDKAITCDESCVSMGSVLRGSARAEDQVYIRGAVMRDNARASGDAMILNLADTNMGPELSENCVVYGKVSGGASIRGGVIVFYPEEIANASLDRFLINDQGRTVVRSESRNELRPRPQKGKTPEKAKSHSKARRSAR